MFDLPDPISKMVKGTWILLLIFIISWKGVFSQHLSHQVIVSAAGITSTGVINYSQTIGETAVQIIENSGFIFTEGFQQPGIKISAENPPPGNGVKVYPNPVTDYVNIELFGEVARTFRIDIINITGTIVSTEKVVFVDQFWNIKQVPVEKLGRGLYFVRIISDDGMISRSFKIEKL
jgi:hypothetical protein